MKHSIVVTCILSTIAFSQPGTLWSRTYDLKDVDYCNDILATDDGGFILAGSAREETISDDVFVLKVNSSGDIVWTTYFGTEDDDEVANAIIPTSDGGYAIAGFTTNTAHSSSFNFLLLKIDSDGNVQWSGDYGGDTGDHAMDLIELSDGGFLVVGYAHDTAYDADIMVVRTDSAGVQEWSNRYLSSWEEYAGSVMELSGGYLLGGWTNEMEDTCSHYMAKLIDYSGDPIDCYVFNSSSAGYAWDMCRSDQGGFVLAGWDSGTGGVLCSDFDGNVQWVTDMSTPGYYYIEAITRTLYSGYLAVGMLESSSSNDDFLAVKLDTNGNILWVYTGDISSGDIALCVVQTPDGGYAIAGKAYAGNYHSDVALIRLESPEGIEEQENRTSIVLAGNPSSACPSFSVTLDNPESVTLNIYDITGRRAGSVFSGNLPEGTHLFSIDDLEPGVYIARLLTEDDSSSMKFTVVQ